MDISDSTVTEETLGKGEIAYKSNGERIVGTHEEMEMTAESIIDALGYTPADEADISGGVEITSGDPEKDNTVLTIDPNAEDENVYTAEETDGKFDELRNSGSIGWVEGTETVEIVPEITVTIDSNGYAAIGASIPALVAGEVYSVTFNGTTYECVARIWDPGTGQPVILLGNGAIYGDGNLSNGEPFVCDVWEAPDGTTIYLNTNPGEYTVSITQTIESIQYMDDKFIPSTIARQNDLESVYSEVVELRSLVEANMFVDASEVAF